MNKMATLYKNARLIDPSNETDIKGDLLVENGVIADVGENLTAHGGVEVIDCKGRILSPGIIDMRSHSVDSVAAAAGGITTVILQPNQTTLIDSDAVVERIRRRSEDGNSVRVYPMGAATQGMAGEQVAEIGQMQESGAVAFTDCNKAVSNPLVMRRLLEYSGYFGALIVQYAQDDSLAAGGFAHEGELATRLGLAGIPAAAEVIQIERDARLSELTGSPVHFALVSSREGVEAVRRAKAQGIKITCATAPHYLMLNDNALEGYRTFAKVLPPLRGEEDRLALIAGLADGTIDVMVSDHNPLSADVKRLPLGQAAAGVVGAETLLALTLSVVHSGKVDLITALKALISTPAQLLKLPYGTLEKGAPADLMIFDAEKPWRILADNFKSVAKNTPFDTVPVQGQVWRTIVDGKTLFSQEA